MRTARSRVAQAVAPSSRIVYADDDPLVLAHARAPLTSSSEGCTAYIHADPLDPQSILTNPLIREVLDFSQPIALVTVAVLHFVPDEYKPERVLATLIDALPSGSYLVASHITGEHRHRPKSVGTVAWPGFRNGPAVLKGRPEAGCSRRRRQDVGNTVSSRASAGAQGTCDVC